MHRGYIKEYRKIVDWEWYTDYKTAHLFRHCLYKANIEDKKWRGIEIKRGSFVTSLEHLSNETGLSIQNIRTSLKKLTSELTYETSNQSSIITVKNYEIYQEVTSELTNNQQTTNKQLTTTKEYKNEKNIYSVKENKKFTPPSLEEIKNYCQERNNNVDFQRFFDYYTVSNWKDKDGKPVKNWKQKLITWERKTEKAPPVKQKKWNPYYNVYAEDEYYRRQYGY